MLPALSSTSTTGSGVPATTALVPIVGSWTAPGRSKSTSSSASIGSSSSSSAWLSTHPPATLTTTAATIEPRNNRRSTTAQATEREPGPRRATASRRARGVGATGGCCGAFRGSSERHPGPGGAGWTSVRGCQATRCGGIGTSSTTRGGRGCFGGRPLGRLSTITLPFSINCPPQTPQGSQRSSAPARHVALSWHLPQMALARAMRDDVVGEEQVRERAVAVGAASLRRARRRRPTGGRSRRGRRSGGRGAVRTWFVSFVSDVRWWCVCRWQV